MTKQDLEYYLKGKPPEEWEKRFEELVFKINGANELKDATNPWINMNFEAKLKSFLHQEIERAYRKGLKETQDVNDASFQAGAEYGRNNP